MSLQVFVSSMCYELRDLRASVKNFLEELGIEPMLSNENGFPVYGGLKPYVSCIKVLDDCPMAIGVIDRQYGKGLADWSPLSQYDDLSPTHAEVRHCLVTKKKILLYIHRDTMAVYEQWRKNQKGFGAIALQNGLTLETLHLISEIKHHVPTPWIEQFEDASTVIKSLKKRLVNEIYQGLMEQKKQNEDEAQYLIGKVMELAPEVRKKVEEGLNPDLVKTVDQLKSQLNDIEEKYRREGTASTEKHDQEKAALTAALLQKEKQLSESKIMLFNAATRDASWLSYVRTHLMDKQPGRVPFHNDAEIALRGYHAGNLGDKTPKLNKVTWSKVAYKDEKSGLHRGYHAAIIYEGNSFAPGITWTCRRKGETAPPAGNKDYFWRQPNIYFGDYLETSSGDDEIEAPLSWRGYEFRVKNPEGKVSDWLEFSYPFDDELLKKIMEDNAQLGRRLYSEGKFKEAGEPLRKAYVFSDRLSGESDPLTKELHALREKSMDQAVLSALRFKPGVKIRVVSGKEAGKTGVIEKIALRSSKPYYVKQESSEGSFYASDSEVEPED